METTTTEWIQGTPGKWNKSEDVHVWRVSLDDAAWENQSLEGLLSTDEITRARRYRFERDQKRFIVARGVLRKILGGYLGIKPRDLSFEYSSRGKPALTTSSNNDNLVFNISHSEAFALCAVGRGLSIGVDIERVREDVAVDTVARRFFSRGEIGQLEKLPKNKWAGLFFQYWTRKEALLKATGEGMNFPMEQFDVTDISAEGFTPLRLPGDKEESSCWYLQDLFPGQGYAAAIAAQLKDSQLSCWDYAI